MWGIHQDKNKISFYITFSSIYKFHFCFEPFLYRYEHFSLTLPCPFSHSYQFDPLEGQFHIYLIPLLFSLNITPGIPMTPTSSSASMEYYLDYIVPTSHSLSTSNPSWMLPNLNNQFLKDLKHSILYPLMISINFPLLVSSHFSIVLTILLSPNEIGKISENIASTGIYQNIQQ